jgi:diaminopimelate epimerase
MCGNGGRCIVQFAIDLGICNDEIRFVAVDGLHLAEKDEKGRIRLKMSDVHDVHNESGDFVLDTGSPHYVKFINDLDNFDVAKEGKHIRNSPKFKDNGINVNFVHILNDHSIYVKTYERGVEDETWSCGTGVTASCLMAAHNESGFNEVDVQTLGGKLIRGICARATQHGIPTIALCGTIDADQPFIDLVGLKAAFAIGRKLQIFDDALASTEENLRFTAEQVMKVVSL